MSKFNVVGLGPGHPDYLLPIGNRVIRESDVLIGGERNLASVDTDGKETIVIRTNLKEIVAYIGEHKDSKKITVIVSGDTGFYSMLGYISKHFATDEYEVVPGISSMQYMFSAIGRTWNNQFVGSVHGRELDVVEKVRGYRYVGLLTDKKITPTVIAELLEENDLRHVTLYVGERLSYEDEVITVGDPHKIKQLAFGELNVIIVENEQVEV